MRFKRFLVMAGLCACTFACAGQGWADDEYEPIKAGSFLLTPKLVIEQSYDDNIYASDDNEESDFVTAAKPSLLIKKLYRDHEFYLDGSAEAVKYWENSDEDEFNYKGEFGGRIVAKRALTLPFKMSHETDHLDRRRERTALVSREPTEFKKLKTEIGAEYEPGRLGFGLYGGYNQTRYDNGESFAGVDIIHEDGDYDSLYARAVVKYHTKTEITPFISFTVAENDFLRRSWDGVGFNGPKRDNILYKALIGASFDYHDYLSGSAAIGQDWRRYDDEGVDDITAFSAEGQIDWMPLRKTKLSFDFLRQSEEDNLVNDGIVETRVGGRVRYELQHDLFLNGMMGWENTKFDETDRTDNLYESSIGLSYMLNRKLELGGEYLYRWRDSTDDNSDFDENIFMLRLTGKF